MTTFPHCFSGPYSVIEKVTMKPLWLQNSPHRPTWLKDVRPIVCRVCHECETSASIGFICKQCHCAAGPQHVSWGPFKPETIRREVRGPCPPWAVVWWEWSAAQCRRALCRHKAVWASHIFHHHDVWPSTVSWSGRALPRNAAAWVEPTVLCNILHAVMASQQSSLPPLHCAISRQCHLFSFFVISHQLLHCAAHGRNLWCMCANAKLFKHSVTQSSEKKPLKK